MLAGNLKIAGTSFLLVVQKTTRLDKYYLISSLSKQDFQRSMMGEQLRDPVISSVRQLKDLFTEDYLIEVLQINKFEDKVAKYGNSTHLELFIDTVADIKRLVEDVKGIDSIRTTDNTTIEEVSKTNGPHSYSHLKNDGKLVEMFAATTGFSVNLKEQPLKLRVDVPLTDISKQKMRDLKGASIENINYARLCQVLDMSWYKENDVVKKKYRSIKNDEEFEKFVMRPLVEFIIQCHERGEIADISLDTETDGLNICNLKSSNEHKSHCVSTQLSWEDDQGVAIFYDMKYFPNCTRSYVTKRLEELFIHRGDFEIVLSKAENPYKLNRAWYELIGHNVMFDRKVMYDEGADVWFDEDSLQMAFNLNTKTVRGSNKLKVLTRNFFGHETPELSDILGKNNEDKFRYLQDEEVVCIYGCADTDYTRQVYHKLKALMPPYMYKRYKAQDIKLLNVLAISEYYGMNTVADKVREQAVKVRDDLNSLKELMYSYVGAHLELITLKSKLDILFEAGNITAEEYANEIEAFKPSDSQKYVFEVKPAEIQNVMYNILKYPIIARTEKGDPKVDKYVVKKLLATPRSEHSFARKLKHDVLHSGCSTEEYNKLMSGDEKSQKKAAGMVLIAAKDFNKYEYPFAYIYQVYSSLNKEYTSYYKPIIENNLEDKMFYHYNMARIETRRIANPGQTMKGSLKKLIKPYSDDYYLLDFDMSQAEYRVMVSIAGFTEMINKMRDPEKDYHTETASIVNDIPPHKVSKKVRKQTKSISFGIPYGLGESSLCDSMFGVINDENRFATRMLMNKWKANNGPVMELLEGARDKALEEWKISDEYRDYIQAWEREYETNSKGKLKAKTDSMGRPVYKLDSNGNKIPVPISKAENIFGFYRTFNLSKIDLSEAAVARRKTGTYDGAESTIRRAAGNYGIQSFAAELFRIILMRFYDKCEERDYHHGDKVIWHMLIHDELLCSVHKSIHPFEVFKLVKEACMLTMKGHTNYFVGINMGDTWGECKDDAREAPVHLVNRISKRWDAGEFTLENTPAEYKRINPETGKEEFWFNHPFDFILPYMNEFKKDRIHEVVLEMQPDADEAPIDVKLILQKFSNYTVRSYVSDYPSLFTVDKELFLHGERDGIKYYDDEGYDNAQWESKFASWIKEQYGDDKEVISSFKGTYCVGDSMVTESKAFVISDEFDDVDTEQEESEFESEVEELFDEEGILDSVFYDESVFDKAEEKEVTKKSKYDNIHIYNGQIVIDVPNVKVKEELKKYLFLYRASSGYTIKFRCGGILERWITLKVTDLNKLDTEIGAIVK